MAIRSHTSPTEAYYCLSSDREAVGMMEGEKAKTLKAKHWQNVVLEKNVMTSPALSVGIPTMFSQDSFGSF